MLEGSKAGWANYDKFDDRKVTVNIGAIKKDYNTLVQAVPKYECVPVEVAKGQLVIQRSLLDKIEEETPKKQKLNPLATMTNAQNGQFSFKKDLAINQ